MKSIKPLHKWLSRVRHMIPGAACAAVMLLGGQHCHAQGEATEQRTMEGRVSRMTTAPKGEIDGAVLEDGCVLHWPPHLEDRFKQVIVKGDRVRVSGRMETKPAGDTQFEVESATNLGSNISATNPDFGAGPPHPPHRDRHGRGAHSEPRSADESAEGRVTRMTKAPRGEIDGAVLEDGTWLHWPPHLEDHFAGVIKKGDMVSSKGRLESGPKGDARFEVQSIKNTQSGVTAENPDFANRPRRGRHPAPPHEVDRRNFDERERTVQGVVKELTTAPRGEIDGALLDDGTVLHWPPHLQDRYTALVKVGANVRAIGSTRTTPHGDTHFEVRSIDDTALDQAANNPEGRPRSARAGEEGDLRRQIREIERQIDDLKRRLGELRGRD